MHGRNGSPNRKRVTAAAAESGQCERVCRLFFKAASPFGSLNKLSDFSGLFCAPQGFRPKPSARRSAVRDSDVIFGLSSAALTAELSFVHGTADRADPFSRGRGASGGRRSGSRRRSALSPALLTFVFLALFLFPHKQYSRRDASAEEQHGNRSKDDRECFAAGQQAALFRLRGRLGRRSRRFNDGRRSVWAWGLPSVWAWESLSAPALPSAPVSETAWALRRHSR